ncbi:interferon alpha-inducible 27 2 isoform X1 [Paramuricea clavata]|uniref:Interferon alpha-inducible 27 2 isoform X1 n=1 Tax=Paramuricea clavata TaxID=317549 RepID=A0A6S7IE56_PARCT|nr:interferon alpha-inducible 27 2 isoform X1 [Paramuricea clavata]
MWFSLNHGPLGFGFDIPVTPRTVGGALVGGVVTAAAAPVILGVAGFTGAGITAGSLGAFMMSALAPTAVGGLVATLQSVGAAGLGYGGYLVAGIAGAVVTGGTVGAICENSNSKRN